MLIQLILYQLTLHCILLTLVARVCVSRKSFVLLFNNGSCVAREVEKDGVEKLPWSAQIVY